MLSIVSYKKKMSEKELLTNFRESIETDGGSNEHHRQSEWEALQMKMFMDYCLFIEELWLDWKEYCSRFFILGDKHHKIWRNVNLKLNNWYLNFFYCYLNMVIFFLLKIFDILKALCWNVYASLWSHFCNLTYKPKMKHSCITINVDI